MTMSGEGSPLPAEARGIVVNGQPKSRVYDLIPTHREGLNLRVRKGSQPPSLARTEIAELDRLGQAIAWAGEAEAHVGKPAKRSLIDFAKAHDGVVGIQRDADHGNYHATAVKETRVVNKEEEQIYRSLDPEERPGIITREDQIVFSMEEDIVLPSGRRVTIDDVYLAIKHAMLGGGISEADLSRTLTRGEVYRLVSEQRLKERIVAKGPVRGYTTKVNWRVDSDSWDDYQGVKARRPRRKRIIKPRNKTN